LQFKFRKNDSKRTFLKDFRWLPNICEQSMAFCCAGSASLAVVVYAFITDLINYHILRILLICNISLTISG
ncbi:hypothetical protein, partial [Escherichia coli]|uniref:hypothetical protein n=1 Tax=Escherichia coli TaxID=562 RepID=UPI0030C72381